MHLIGLENGSATENAAQNQHGHDGRRDGGRHRHSRLQAQVNVGGSHDNSQKQTNKGSTQCQFFHRCFTFSRFLTLKRDSFSRTKF